MIPVAKVKKPSGFDTKVKTPGTAWLAANPRAKRPNALWEPYTAALSDGFDGLCGYAAMHDPTGGTVDHYLSFKNRPAEERKKEADRVEELRAKQAAMGPRKTTSGLSTWFVVVMRRWVRRGSWCRGSCGEKRGGVAGG